MAVAIVVAFGIASVGSLTVTTPVTAQNMTGDNATMMSGNMTADNKTSGNWTK
jgi:hypothetical protein